MTGSISLNFLLRSLRPRVMEFECGYCLDATAHLPAGASKKFEVGKPYDPSYFAFSAPVYAAAVREQ